MRVCVWLCEVECGVKVYLLYGGSPHQTFNAVRVFHLNNAAAEMLFAYKRDYQYVPKRTDLNLFAAWCFVLILNLKPLKEDEGSA